MLIIGLTGGSGSGKGYVAELLSCAAIPSIDTDAVYHEMCRRDTPCMGELAARFGEGIFRDDGSLDRQLLAGIVFNDPPALDFLNRTTHKYILAECELLLAEHKKAGADAAVIDAPLLFESGFDKRCDFVVSVVAGDDERVKRIVARDGICREDAEQRIAKQKSNEFFIENSDYVLYNNDSDMIERQVAALVSDLRRRNIRMNKQPLYDKV